jgi:hypothetical protein
VPLPTPEGPEIIRGRRNADPSTGWSKLLQLTLLVMPLVVAVLSPLPLLLLLLLLLPPRVMRCRRVGGQVEPEEEGEEEKPVPLRHAKPDDDDDDDPGGEMDAALVL